MKRVAILSFNHNKYSETFIHNQVKMLPVQAFLMYGNSPSEYNHLGKKFMADGKWNELFRALKVVAGQSIQEQHSAKIEAYLLHHKIEAVIANYAITAFPIMEICAKHSIPLIVHFHGWTAYRSTILEAHKADYKRMFQIANAIVGVSKDMIAQLIKIGAASDKLHLIPYGINEQLFKYSDHSQNEPIFFAAGRFCDTKNPHLTILAFSKVLIQIPNAKLILAGGDENLLNACTQLAHSLSISNKIEFCGILSPEQMVEKMQKSLAFVQHSATTILGEKEGAPVTIIEASASGLPIIATRHAGIPDIVIEEETGLLSNELNIEAMAANMIRLAQNRDLVKQMGLRGAKHIETNFSMSQYISHLNQVIMNATKTKNL